LRETFKNSINSIDVEQAIRYYKELGIAVIVNDGKDITLEIEKAPSQQA